MFILLSILIGFISTEVIGYAVHRLIHSGKVSWLENNHMEHHLALYPPGESQRSEVYREPRKYKTVFGIGLEWFIPITAVAIPSIALLLFLGVPVLYVGAGVLTSLAWAGFAMSYMHNGMHIDKFWAARKNWYRKRRRLHDIHHHSLDSVGKMDSNFGILFHGFDRIFGTYKQRV